MKKVIFSAILAFSMLGLMAGCSSTTKTGASSKASSVKCGSGKCGATGKCGGSAKCGGSGKCGSPEGGL